MSALHNITDTPLFRFGLHESENKCLATALGVTILVVGLLAIAYLVCSLTPLIHTWKILAPLAQLSGLSRIFLIVGCSVPTLFSLVLIILKHKRFEAPKPILQSHVFQKVDEIAESLPDAKKNLGKIKKVLKSNCANYLEHYGFYYQLACVTERVQFKDDVKEKWKSFLNEIQGTTIWREDSEQPFFIDCSVELERLEGNKPVIKIEELKQDSVNIKQDLLSIDQICLSAFPNWSAKTERSLESYFFDQGFRHPYVLRNAHNNEILGFVILEEKISGAEKTLFIHTLAREASAVKLGLTEKLKEHFLKNIEISQYASVLCEVRKDNLPAQSIYRKLGFQIISQTWDAFCMQYKPSHT